MTTGESNLQLARDYLAALERFAGGEELEDFFHPEVIQEELPNSLTPEGARRDLQAILAAAEAGQRTLTKQAFHVTNAIADDWRVAMEVEWEGALRAGGTMRARFAMFLEIRNGKIDLQRNYDCFEPRE